MLGEFLKMADIKTRICKIYESRKNTKSRFLKDLLRSNARFLHISAHGNKNGFSLQDKGETKITAKSIQNYCTKRTSGSRPFNPLHKKFVTISACGHVSAEFVKKLHGSTRVTGVISALAPLGFADSALFASLFYFSLFKESEDFNDLKDLKFSELVALYVDAYQRTKVAYLSIGGAGAHRLDYWWNAEHVVVN